MIDAEHPSMNALIEEMNEVVVRFDDPLAQARATAERLGRLLAKGGDIEETFTRMCSAHYARYRIYKHPDDRFCIVAMVWGPGQGTGLHDHGGVWCVEGVYRGQMHITRYELDGVEGDLMRFHPTEDLTAGVGEVGNLVPPSEYHVMENLGSEPAISIHVYGHELKSVHKYEPVGDGVHFRQREVSLCYDNGA
jgi:predicted metal-dependent enzyme (double-stranded beta helix superfamily)